METSEEDNKPSGRATPRPLAQLKKVEPRVARRRLSQARHRATLAGLFRSLRKTVYSHSDLTASKWQVLNKAKNHIQDLEQTLANLLKQKESFNLEDGNVNSLEEVKEEYASMYCKNPSLMLNTVHQKGSDTWCPIEAVRKEVKKEEEEEEEDEEEEEEAEEKNVELLNSPVTLLPDLLEFERYLNFYKQTMDLLTENGIVSSQEGTLPIVSAAISHMWQTLSEERKASLQQAWAQKHSGLLGLAGACQEPACAEGSVKDSGVESQGASCSLVSTPEEILFEDAFDVASFLDKSEAPSTSSSSSVLAVCNPENTEEKFQLYMQIVSFFKGLCCVNTQFKQEPDLPVDDEMVMLRCMETFDDEDL
ncbi:stimulated by retinoic acid gene 8 protein homolog [Mesoplodon densirostris]|uniref:stimulated by retinoic acid gene 8 protein homolog n=1 Tax=Mesoplodon densirostris TaxID=48708 RepID=UPI0028DBB05C|nr:stimulated by retinoic acid gene 8 protein homolog [Mesoplodon densirostris]